MLFNVNIVSEQAKNSENIIVIELKNVKDTIDNKSLPWQGRD